MNLIVVALCVFQIVKVWSEDGAGKVVEIPADMTARDVCQLLVYKSHCVDDSAWTLVEHHPILGLGKGCSQTGVAAPAFDGSGAKFQPKSVLPTGLFFIFPLKVSLWRIFTPRIVMRDRKICSLRNLAKNKKKEVKE